MLVVVEMLGVVVEGMVDGSPRGTAGPVISSAPMMLKLISSPFPRRPFNRGMAFRLKEVAVVAKI